MERGHGTARNSSAGRCGLPSRPQSAPLVIDSLAATDNLGLGRVAMDQPKRRRVLLCHKTLARFDVGFAGVEILTRGGGLWVSNQGTRQRITVCRLCRGDHVGAWPCRSCGAVPIVLRGTAVARRSQERRADGGPRAAGACAGGAPIAASFRGKGRVVGRRGARGSARPCPAHHRAARPDPAP